MYQAINSRYIARYEETIIILVRSCMHRYLDR